MTELETMEELETEERLNWKMKMLIGGAVTGAILGAGTSFLMARASEEKRGGPPELKTMEVLKIAISLFGLIRGIAALGDD
jgi:hypothetical protein